jgi:hypothetical protein
VVVICPIVMVVAVTPGPLIDPLTLGGGGMVEPVPEVDPGLPAPLGVLEIDVLEDELHAARLSPAAQTVASRRTVSRRLDCNLTFPFFFARRNEMCLSALVQSAGTANPVAP